MRKCDSYHIFSNHSDAASSRENRVSVRTQLKRSWTRHQSAICVSALNYPCKLTKTVH